MRSNFGLIVCVSGSLACGQVVSLTPGQELKGQIAGEITAVQNLYWRATTDEKEQELIRARRDYWGSTGEERVAAESAYARTLYMKDEHFVRLAVEELKIDIGAARGDQLSQRLGTSSQAASYSRLMKGALGAQKSLGGGVIPFAEPEFRLMVNKLRETAGQHLSRLRADERFLWTGHVLPEYVEYLRQRVLAESLFVNPRGVLRNLDPDPGEYLTAWILGTRIRSTKPEATAIVDAIKGSVSAAAFQETVRIVRENSVVTREVTGPFQRGQAMEYLNKVVQQTSAAR